MTLSIKEIKNKRDDIDAILDWCERSLKESDDADLESLYYYVRDSLIDYQNILDHLVNIAVVTL